MEKFREKIDICDTKIVNALIERFEIVKEIGEYKKKNNMPIVDKAREQKVYEKVKGLANSKIPDDVIENIYKVIISSACEMEK